MEVSSRSNKDDRDASLRSQNVQRAPGSKKGSSKKKANSSSDGVLTASRQSNSDGLQQRSSARAPKTSPKEISFNSKQRLQASTSSKLESPSNALVDRNPPLIGAAASRQRGHVLSPLSSSMDPYTSTTDDDDEIRANRPSSLQQLAPAETSPGPSLQRNGIRQPLAATTAFPFTIGQESQTALPIADEWDYSATERWGWIILIATWIVFVVGIGSCLGIWSWAWDVGETPHAPSKLKNDPTLPIVGYYPALMVLTVIMAWIWVIVAWVGMKYFKHAKIQGDET